MLTIKAMTGGASYAANHLSNSDYYAEGETVTGQWYGRGAELLGLSGAVTLDHFNAVREGFHPETGEFLRQRKSADRFSEDGKKMGSARNLYDFTISAPKGVSVMAMIDPRIADCHSAAVADARAQLQELSSTRIRKNGANANRLTGNLIIAQYDHTASRALDPQLHSHLVAANLTFDAVEHKWKALQPNLIYEQRAFLSEVYRNSLAHRLMTLGYSIVNQSIRGVDNGFNISGIQESTLDKFSRRSAQRDAEIQTFMAEHGRLPNNDEIAILIRESRPEKLAHISSAEVKASQISRLSAEEADNLSSIYHQASIVAAQTRPTIENAAANKASFDYAQEHLFERLSVVKTYELYTEALRHGRGTVDLTKLQACLTAQLSDGTMISSKNEVATKESLAREQLMVSTINSGSKAYPRMDRGHEVRISAELREEQKLAVHEFLHNRDFAFNLRGAAGTGKTATLREIKRTLAECRRSVIAVAPTTSATEELRKVGFGDARTIASILSGAIDPLQLRGQVLIIDEAGMVSSQDMASLIQLAKHGGARILFSGDTAQIKSVNEGDALRILERESRLASVSLLQVQRQVDPNYKEAVELLRNSPTSGFEKLESMGAIKQVHWQFRSEEASQAYRQEAAIPNRKGGARSLLVIAKTHAEIKNITFAIRRDLKREGRISDGLEFINHSAMQWTTAQKKNLRNYRVGQVLTFHRHTKDVAKDTSVTVLSSDHDEVLGRTEHGQTVVIKPRSYAKAFSVFETDTLEVSPGDKLLLQANRNPARFQKDAFRATNGDLVEVASVAPGTITLTDGRILPPDYRQFSHGYAVTADRGQGKTVDYQIVVTDSMAHDRFYVAVSRGQEGVTVITSDKQTLEESITRSGDRQSATELAAKAAIRNHVNHELALLTNVHQKEQYAHAHANDTPTSTFISHSTV